MFSLFKKKHNSDESTDNESIRLACDSGNDADQLAAAGKLELALTKYNEIIAPMEQSRRVDAYLLGKAVLGKLFAYQRTGKLEEGFQLWTSSDQSMDALGIKMLEEASQQFHGNDMCLYFLISAYYHAMGRSENALDSVMHYLNIVNRYTLNQNQDNIKLVSSHWYINLGILSGLQPPDQMRQLLDQIYEKFPAADEPQLARMFASSGNTRTFDQRKFGEYFPSPAVWEVEKIAATFHPDGSVSAG